jgi:two-component system response regulator MprA
MRAQNQLEVFFYRRKDTRLGGQRQSGPHGLQFAEYALAHRDRHAGVCPSQYVLSRSRQTEHMRILVVDDDRAVRESLRRSLSFNGYTVDLAVDGMDALEKVTAARPDALVLDVMMPRLDGLEVCRRLRSTGDDLPILVLTARDSVSERVAGLDAGADDYLPKPFALEELLARLRALLRRRAPDPGEASEAMVFADLSLDPVTREVSRGERAISLTRTEFSLLEMLMANPRRVLTRGRILEEVWGYDFPTSGNALEVYIGYLRRKTEADGEERLIHTVRGVGYVLRETPP